MAENRTVYCKNYHRALKVSDPGLQRGHEDAKSRCPGWVSDPELRRRLLDDAIEDPDGDTDWMGRPKRLWNAVDSWFFVAVSTNQQDPVYNCYPEVPATQVFGQLLERAKRSIEDLLNEGSQ